MQCDQCGAEGPTTIVTVSPQGGRAFVVSLCNNDMEPVDQWAALAAARPKAHRVSSKPAAHRVIPID